MLDFGAQSSRSSDKLVRNGSLAPDYNQSYMHCLNEEQESVEEGEEREEKEKKQQQQEGNEGLTSSTRMKVSNSQSARETVRAAAFATAPSLHCESILALRC